MMDGPQAHWLQDGKRLHLNHGPIDLIVEAFGEVRECRLAYEQAVARFQTILIELVKELPELRLPAFFLAPRVFDGPTARRMEAAVIPLADCFITPMAAVAGSVADEMLAALVAGRKLDRAYVNNGGDCALYIGRGQSMGLAVAGTGPDIADRITIRSGDGIRGVATSGWRGRSFSLGIADAVTVLARTGAEADAAATLIANAVNLPGNPAIKRTPACELSPDSDLGARLVTQGVGTLALGEVERALDNGLAVAEDFRRRGLIAASALFLAGQARISGSMALAAPNKSPGKEVAHA
jgi:ApbE superfamily uncharacterized protein (UPF0280 family)